MSTPSSQRVEHSSRTTEPVDDGASAITVDDEAISAPQLTDAEWQRVKVIRLRPVLADSAKNALAGIAGTLLIALLSWHGAGSTYDPLVPWVWWLAYMAIGVWIIAIAKRFAGSRNQGVDVVLAMRQLFMPTVAAGFVWGSSAWLMLPAPGSQVELVIVIGHAMVLMAVVNGRSTDRPSLLAFVIPATGVFVLGLVRLGDTFHLALSLGFLVFTVALVSFARVREEAVDTAVQLRIRTENLLRERTVQHRLTEEALRDAERSREQAQRATESAMRANHEKSNFMAAIGHDLRQPMHALVQYHGHLLRSDKDPALASAIYGIGKSLDSMRDLLDSIAEVSRLMTGLVKPTLSTFELSPLLTRLEAQAQPMAEEKGLTFSIGRVAAIVQSDEVLLERILRNLVVNAIRYTESGHVAVRATVRANRLVVCVADSGIGIAATDKERIFE